MTTQGFETISHRGVILALIVRAEFRASGIHFFTPDQFSQQLGFMGHPAGKVIRPHIHRPVSREIQFTQEVLIIKSGKLRVDLYDEAQSYVESRFLNAGDVVLLSAGGHGFEVIEDTEMFEVKQGPYGGEVDKVLIPAVEASRRKEI